MKSSKNVGKYAFLIIGLLVILAVLAFYGGQFVGKSYAVLTPPSDQGYLSWDRQTYYPPAGAKVIIDGNNLLVGINGQTPTQQGTCSCGNGCFEYAFGTNGCTASGGSASGAAKCSGSCTYSSSTGSTCSAKCVWTQSSSTNT